MPDIRASQSARDGSGDWCLFLDRDGVINRQIVADYVRTWDQFEFLPGAVAAIAALSTWAPYIVVVTNQQGVGKGLLDAAELDKIHDRMRSEVEAAGGRIDAILVCPHLESDDCECRKPRPGMAREWLRRHPQVKPERCIVVGDSDSDLEMAQRLSSGHTMGVLIGSGNTRSPGVTPDARYESLWDFSQAHDNALQRKAAT